MSECVNLIGGIGGSGNGMAGVVGGLGGDTTSQWVGLDGGVGGGSCRVNSWISTSEANRIVGLGICDKTFRNKFRDLIECRKDAHGYLRWYRKDVEELAKN